MKKIILTLCLFAIATAIFPQNQFPSTSHAVLDGNSIFFNIPSTTGGWARGNFFRDPSGSTIWAGAGLYGRAGASKRLYLAHGSDPWSSNLGIHILSSGNVGVGTTSPNTKLDVEGNLRVANTIEFFRGDSEYSNYIRSQNFPSTGQDGVSQKYWLEYGTKGGHHFVVNTNGGIGDTENIYDDFTIWQGEVDGDRLMSVSNVGNTYISGNVGIGTTDPGAYKLAVNGDVHAKKVRVDLEGWPDYVFAKGYDLPTLEEIQRHIREKGHLPNIPSAKEVKANGIELGEMDRLLLEKIEELTLLMIEKEKQFNELEKRLTELEKNK